MSEILKHSPNDTVNHKENTEGYRKHEWYKNLTPEQKEIYDKSIKEISDLKKEIHNKEIERKLKWLEESNKKELLNKDHTEFSWSFEKFISFEETIDTLRKDIDSLQRILYQYNLELNKKELMSSFEKSNEYFKKWLLKESEENPEIKNLIEKKDLSNITAWEIYSLRQAWYDLSKLFLIWWWEVSKETMKVWDKFTVNFWWNQSLNAQIWAWDILDFKKFDKVKVNGVVWTRKFAPRPWYYEDNGRYLAIFDNYEVEILSEKEFSQEESQEAEEAFKNRYKEIRHPEVILNLLEQLKSSWNASEIKLDWFTKYDMEEVVVPYFDKYLSKELREKITFDKETWKISSRNNQGVYELIKSSLKYENLWKWYEKYKEIVYEVAKENGIAPEDLINLVNHENWKWDPMATVPWSSAYWLCQLTNDSWNYYGKWLDRNNPRDQLTAACRCLNNILRVKRCPMQIAMWYYNTWMWVMNVGIDTIKKFARLNPAISRRIPSNVHLTHKAYFTAAVSYYSDISFERASALVW